MTSGHMDKVESVFGRADREASETIRSGMSSSLGIPVCSVAAGPYDDNGTQVMSVACMTRMLCIVTGAGLFTLSGKVLLAIHRAINSSTTTTTTPTRTLRSINHGKYIGVQSDAGPLVNVTTNGIVLYMGAPGRYADVMEKLLSVIRDLFTSREGPSVAAHMSRVAKYQWVLKLRDTT